MALKNLGDGTLTKLAADANPTATSYPAGTALQNTDDRKRWINSGTDWILQDFPLYNQFKVFKAGTTTYVTDRNGKVQQSNSDTQVAVQAQIDAMPTGPTVYEFDWDSGLYTMNNPILIPSTTQAAFKKVIMKGSGYTGLRETVGNVTMLDASTSFPTNRYIFELSSPGAANVNGGMVDIDGFQASNRNNFPAGTFNGVNVGFVKLEAGVRMGFDDYVITRCYGNYMWRMLHLIGAIWSGRFENITTFSTNATFLGDAHVVIEDGGHSSVIEPTPKVNRFKNIHLYDASGEMVNGIRIKSGQYNQFDNIYVGGIRYQVAVLNMSNTDALPTSSNTLRDLIFIDLQPPAVDTRQAAIYLAGTSVCDNSILNIRCAQYPLTAKLSGTGVEKNLLQFSSIWGNIVSITDTGSDPSNTYEIFGGNTTSADAPITHTGGVGRVIDKRRGASARGSTTFSGDGTTTIFNIPHGLFAAPTSVQITKRGTAIRDINFTLTTDATNIVVTFATPPVSGGSNMILYWTADVYD
jgi:hypothetical protein